MYSHKKDNDKEEKETKKLKKKLVEEKNYRVGKSREEHENFLKENRIILKPQQRL